MAMHGKAILLATAAATAAIAGCATGGLGWVLAAAAGGAIGNIADRHLVRALRACGDRLAGLADPDRNHDFARGLRLAQLEALEQLLRDYQAATAPAAVAFCVAALGFCARAVGRHPDPAVKLNLTVTATLAEDIQRILGPAEVAGPSAQRQRAVAALAEDAVLRELAQACFGADPPEPIETAPFPPGFVAHFRDGVGEGRPRFLDLFGGAVARQVKVNDAFRAMLTGGQLARIEASPSTQRRCCTSWTGGSCASRRRSNRSARTLGRC